MKITYPEKLYKSVHSHHIQDLSRTTIPERSAIQLEIGFEGRLESNRQENSF